MHDPQQVGLAELVACALCEPVTGAVGFEFAPGDPAGWIGLVGDEQPLVSVGAGQTSGLLVGSRFSEAVPA